MTTAAWLMLAATWSVVVYFTATLFYRVVKSPPRDGEVDS